MRRLMRRVPDSPRRAKNQADTEADAEISAARQAPTLTPRGLSLSGTLKTGALSQPDTVVTMVTKRGNPPAPAQPGAEAPSAAVEQSQAAQGAAPAPQVASTGDQTPKSAQRAVPKVHKRGSIDKDAVWRDYRTSQMTLREIAAKHGCSHALVGKWAREHKWERDLGPAVKAATAARLMQETVTTALADGVQAVTDTVLAAAEINTRVILGHRRDISKLSTIARNLMDSLDLDKSSTEALKSIAGQVAETPEQRAELAKQLHAFLGTHTRVTSVQRLADTLLKLQSLERRAHGLGDGDDPPPPAAPPPDGSDPAEAYRWLTQQRAA